MSGVTRTRSSTWSSVSRARSAPTRRCSAPYGSLRAYGLPQILYSRLQRPRSEALRHTRRGAGWGRQAVCIIVPSWTPSLGVDGPRRRHDAACYGGSTRCWSTERRERLRRRRHSVVVHVDCVPRMRASVNDKHLPLGTVLDQYRGRCASPRRDSANVKVLHSNDLVRVVADGVAAARGYGVAVLGARLDCERPAISVCVSVCGNCIHLETRPQRPSGVAFRCHFGSFACTLMDSSFNAASADLGTVLAVGAEILESKDEQSSVWIIETPSRCNSKALADPCAAGVGAGLRCGVLLSAELRVQGRRACCCHGALQRSDFERR
jgi:hypothetical protein